jgi:hypothetical protein
MRLAIVVAAALAVVACGTSHPFGTRTMVKSTKTVNFHRQSINLHPMPVKLDATEGEGEGPDGTEGAGMILPDGSYVKLSGGGSAGNLMLVVNQNDGTEQAADTKTDATADLDASGTIPASGTEFYLVDEKGERR